MVPNGTEPIPRRVRAALEPHCPPGTGLLIALSGGVDSCVLFDALCSLADEARLNLTAAHLDHGIREESGQDADFVEDLAKKAGIPVIRARADVPRYAAEHGLSLEEAARCVRYDFLESTREKAGAKWIVTAHHRDDEAETMLLRLARGTSLTGLGGMDTVSGHVLRPMLEISRAEILLWAKARGLAWREDRTNADDTIPRNAVRHHILPALEKIHPGAAENAVRTAELLRRDDDCLKTLALPLAEGMAPTGIGWRLPVSPFGGVHPALVTRALLFAAWKAGFETPWGRDHLDALAALIDAPTGTSLTLPGHVLVTREREALFWRREGEAIPPAAPVPFPPKERNLVFPSGVCETWEDTGENGRAQWLDADRIPADAVLRGRLPGDIMVPLGMTGHRKLKEILRDDGIPAADRDAVIVLAAGNRVLHILGTGRIDDSVRITPQTIRYRAVRWHCRNGEKQ